MEINEFKRIVSNFWDSVRKQGYAAHAVILNESTLQVEGRTLPYSVAVPIHCSPGKKVFVHIEDGKAVVIGS